MDILLRFLTLTLRENQTELQLSEMRKKQVFILHTDRRVVLTKEHRRFLRLA
ncbi:hypothetical protein [Microvirga lenta]|uniref:hypothetical protein n=1 Tax=Microvirga lenta TaxID=2881337 RepID=UPI001CFC6FDC|nr:hypothetical protein [Microvirga lenta]MCB5173668.1 hypothetical protein [Microvirga lenta]